MGIFVLGAAGINFLYGRGDFSQHSTYHTVLCLWGYGLGLVPSVFVLFFASAFYAVKDYRVPTVGCVLSVVVNILLNALFVFTFHWGAFSVAVSTSLCAFFNFFYLSYHLKKRWGQPLFDFSVYRSFFKTGISALTAAVIALCSGHFLLADPSIKMLLGVESAVYSRQFIEQLLHFAALSGTFVMVFFSCAWMLNAEDVLELCRLKRKIQT
jgi:putative peptidoglycan lipid II flippase